MDEPRPANRLLSLDAILGREEDVPVYEPRLTNLDDRPIRRTNAEMAVIDEAIMTAVRDEHPVTLRGVFYRVVSAGVIPKTEHAYKLIGRQLLKLRRAGEVPVWLDRRRHEVDAHACYVVQSERDVDNRGRSYRRALWDNQDPDVMILSEKDAITGVIYPVTAQYDVPLGVLRGYSSETFCRSVADDIDRATDDGRQVFVCQLGDHDPSGVDAWRAFETVVEWHLTDLNPDQESDDWLEEMVHFERIAVTPEQIELYDLPTRPTKQADTRAKNLVGESVEVDAIPATILRQLVQGHDHAALRAGEARGHPRSRRRRARDHGHHRPRASRLVDVGMTDKARDRIITVEEILAIDRDNVAPDRELSIVVPPLASSPRRPGYECYATEVIEDLDKQEE
jgi:hypothetical protein